MNSTVVVQKKHVDTVFFRTVAIAACFVIFAGFARTYYLKAWTRTPALPPLVHVHAVLFTAWILFFLVQTKLVASNRVDLHRKLGVFGTLLAIAMIVEGSVAAIGSVRRGFMGVFPNQPTGFVDPIAFFSLAI